MADLFRQTLVPTKDADHLSIRSKFLSIQVGKTVAAHMLNGNFAMDKVMSLNSKANSIDPFAFLPQRNAYMIEQERLKDMISKTENTWMSSMLTKPKARHLGLKLVPWFQLLIFQASASTWIHSVRRSLLMKNLCLFFDSSCCNSSRLPTPAHLRDARGAAAAWHGSKSADLRTFEKVLQDTEPLCVNYEYYHIMGLILQWSVAGCWY